MGLESRFVQGQKVYGTYKVGDNVARNKLIESIQGAKKVANIGHKWLDANHGWNQVKIDGRWYHLDVSYDAAISQRNRQYTYPMFLVSDKTLEKVSDIEKLFSEYSHITSLTNQVEPDIL